jgi:SPP1 gp7 family putative phage head morphogenesis protein
VAPDITGPIILSNLYADCGCGHVADIALTGHKDILDQFLADVHSGKLTADSIQPDFYKNLSAQLVKAVAEGLGGSIFKNSDYTNTLKAYLDHNIYAFSGAKSLVELRLYNKLLLGDDGEILPYNQFKAKALQVDELYNKTYLSAEYENAVASAQMAEKWQGLQGFKYLEYRTVGDDKVRPQHKILDGLILESRDPIWNRIYPPNGWRCRCTVIPAASNDTPTNRTTAKDYEKVADIEPYFKKNVGKEKTIFADGHPYIQEIGSGKIKEFDAEKNYGMDGVEKIYKKGDFPKSVYMADKSSALQWWQEQAGSIRGSFDVKTADGLTVTFDNKFRNHVIEQNADNRWKIINKVPEVLQKPDEIWSRMIDKELSLTYIKYYDKAPILVQVDAEGTVRGSTMVEMQHNGKINTAEMIKVRKGQLKFKQ